MFSFLLSILEREARPARRPRLIAEVLESREGPSTLMDPWMMMRLSSPAPRAPVVAPPPPAPNQAPVIADFQAIVGPNGVVTFVGKVTDDQSVAGMVVRIQGDGIDLTATVLADGTFQASTMLHATNDITVSATTTDPHGAASNPVYTTFTPSPSGL